MVNISVDVRGFDDVMRSLDRLPGELRDRAMVASINKVAQKAQAEVTRAVTERFAVKADLVRGAIVVHRAANRPGRVTASLDIFGSPTKRGRSMNMIRFLAAFNQAKLRGSKATKAQIAALGAQLGFQITKDGGLKQIPGAFIGNKGRTVFQRVGNARLPIKPVQVIGVSQMFKTRSVEQRVMRRIDAELLVETERAVRMVLERMGR